ncbi:hypothetical protein RvY_03480 [Ramazzottius varieornatus]|uniref:Paired domain-containing protein n=1 Tax=Ramazzottius varieornatus TaxID=947166 RepID=A0A1D1UTY0_RAMVA|nr:hypothetical protein RvY_03480 [Ramazzottius varieornatus]
MSSSRSEHALQIRELVIRHHSNRVGASAIARRVCLPRTTVQNMIKKFEMTGSAEVKRRPGPTRKTTALIDRIIVRKAK